MAKLVGGVVELREAGGEVLAAVVVDEGYFGGLVVLELGGGDDPAEGVALLAKVSGQLAVELLTGHGDVLIVEIYLHKYLELLVDEVGTEGLVLLLCIERESECARCDDGKKSFHSDVFDGGKGTKYKSINR